MKLCKKIMDKEFNTIICSRIRKLRQEHGITIEQLAYQSGISKGGLSEIEREMKEPKIYTVMKLCSGLGISMSEFFNFDELKRYSENL